MSAASLKRAMLAYAEEHGLDELTEVYEQVCEEWHDGDDTDFNEDEDPEDDLDFDDEED